jgi:hypothetical protein
MTAAAELVRIDRPCKLQFTIDSITNAAALSEPFNICALTRGACASSAFSRLKVKGKVDPKSPAVDPMTLLCDVWWRPVAVRFACCDAAAGAEFPEGGAVLGAGQWQLPEDIACDGRGNGPECEFSIDLVSPSGTGDVAVSMSGKVCAVWNEQLSEDANCVGDAVDGMIIGALAAHDDKRLNALAADVCASVSLLHCLSTIDLLSITHELPRPLLPPDADSAAPSGDVHMRGVLPVIRRPPPTALKVHLADASAATAKVPSHAKAPSVRNTPRAADAADADAPPRNPPPAALPLQCAAQANLARPSTAHPSRKQHDAQLLDSDDGASLHSGHVPPCTRACCTPVTCFAADSSDKKSRPKSAPIKKAS